MERMFKKCARYVGVVIGSVLSYIGALAIIAHFWHGDERSLFAAVFAVVLVACLIAMKGGAE